MHVWEQGAAVTGDKTRRRHVLLCVSRFAARLEQQPSATAPGASFLVAGFGLPAQCRSRSGVVAARADVPLGLRRMRQRARVGQVALLPEGWAKRSGRTHYIARADP